MSKNGEATLLLAHGYMELHIFYIYIYKNPILNSKTNLQVLEHFPLEMLGLEFSFFGGKNEKLW